MAKVPAIGHIECHVCGFDAEVKRDKNGRAYVFCPECNIQSFTRTDYQSEKLLEKMRPVTVKAEKIAVTVTENKTIEKEKAPEIKKAGFSLGGL